MFAWGDSKLEHAKIIVAQYLGITPESIDDGTLINYKAARGSIMLHRMYAALADSGVRVNDPSSIRNYGDLVNAMAGMAGCQESGAPVGNAGEPRPDVTAAQPSESDVPAIGIDIQDISEISVPADPTASSFFTDNFSPDEIEYCAAQPDARASFAARFALKEAIVKADNRLIGVPFNKLPIQRNCRGGPQHPGFLLSCSHSKNQVVAVAVKWPARRDVPSVEGSYVTEEHVLRLMELESQRHEKQLAVVNRRANVMIALFVVAPVVYFILKKTFGLG